MLLPILGLLVMHVLMPGYLIYSLLASAKRDRLTWLLEVLIGAALVLFVTLVGRWDWVSRYLRFVPIALYAGAAVLSYRRLRDKPFTAERAAGRWLPPGMASALPGLLVVAVLLGIAVAGQFFGPRPVSLAFPLLDGSYYVAQGGSTFIVNYHRSHPEQAFAADITKLNGVGMRAAGLRPRALDRYAIFGDTVYSPCDGTVLDAVDGLPDLTPPERDTEHPPGNHVRLDCGDVTVVLAHLQQGSLAVEPGDEVATGQMLGRIGNSGNTDEPHLHIHAYRGGGEDEPGTGVPMRFDGRLPVRNTVYTR